MTEEQLFKKLKNYKWAVFTLISLLLACIGYSYSLRLDIDYLEIKVADMHNKIDIIQYSYIRNINEWIWSQQ